MPIYEYQCDSCSEHYEVFQKVTARPLNKCEKCGGRLHKLISQSSFHLKGSGWYVTDYKGKKQESEAAPKKTETKPTEAKPAETKPAETRKSQD